MNVISILVLLPFFVPFVPRFLLLDKMKPHRYYYAVKRDVLIATIGGFLIGAVAAVGVVNLPKLLSHPDTSEQPDASEVVSATTSPPETPDTSSSSLTLSSPPAGTVVSSSSITVEGKARPGAILVLDTDSDSLVQTVSPDGLFSIQTSLHEGGNTLTITAYSAEGENETYTTTVFFLNETV